MIRVGFTGVPGAGKTSTARALVSKLRSIEGFKRVELVQEYARRYISKHGSMTGLWEQYRIINKQVQPGKIFPRIGHPVTINIGNANEGIQSKADFDIIR